jgi:betaine-aldehyde dehydrogenase
MMASAKAGIFVDGDMVAASAGELIPVINPYTRETTVACTAGNEHDVNRAVVSAQRAFQGEWSSCPLAERVRLVERLAEAVDRSREEIAGYTTDQMGMPIRDSRLLNNAVEMMHALVDSARSIDFESTRRDKWGNTLVVRNPVGVVGGIVPWNASLRSVVKKAVPALLAGCTVVIKPAPETPLEALYFAELAIRVGFPPGVINVVPGGAPAGAALAGHPGVAAIGFTGSSESGAKVAAAAAPTFKRLQLELGGKSAALILDDADVSLAAQRVAQSVFRSSGQTCIALSRAFVPAGLHEAFVEGVVSGARALVLGDPRDPATTMGPLATERQRERVQTLVAMAASEGASFASGGRALMDEAGWFFEPTVVVGANNDMTIAREEIFGPVLTVIQYEREADAVRQANDSRYGLHGAVFSGDADHGLAVASRVATGSVSLNGAPIPITAPFGGVKASGIGREHGPEGFEHVLEYKSLILGDA